MGKIEAAAQLDKSGKSPSMYVDGINETISKGKNKGTLVSVSSESVTKKKAIQTKTAKKDKKTTVITFQYSK